MGALSGDYSIGWFIKERCRLSLKVLEESHEFANLQEIKTSAALATYIYTYAAT